MSKSQLFRLFHQAENDFAFHKALLAAKHGDPRTSTNGGMKREYFELGDGKVIMFASPLVNHSDSPEKTEPEDATTRTPPPAKP